MKPDKCSFCRGKLFKGETDFIAKVKGEVISIKNVPAYVCENCAEAFFTPEISGKMHRIMMDFHADKFLAHPIAAGEVELEMQPSSI